MAQEQKETRTKKKLTVEDAIIEVREHEVVVDWEVVHELAKDLPPDPICGMIKLGFPVSSSDYEEGMYDQRA